MGQESAKWKEMHKTGMKEEWQGGSVLETLVKGKNKKEEKQCTRTVYQNRFSNKRGRGRSAGRGRLKEDSSFLSLFHSEGK